MFNIHCLRWKLELKPRKSVSHTKKLKVSRTWGVWSLFFIMALNVTLKNQLHSQWMSLCFLFSLAVLIKHSSLAELHCCTAAKLHCCKASLLQSFTAVINSYLVHLWPSERQLFDLKSVCKSDVNPGLWTTRCLSSHSATLPRAKKLQFLKIWEDTLLWKTAWSQKPNRPTFHIFVKKKGKETKIKLFCCWKFFF